MTDSHVTTEQALSAIDQERTEREAFLNAIGLERMLEPSSEPGWSVKDLLGHINGWDERAMTREEAIVNGQPAPDLGWPDSDDVDVLNAWIYEHNQHHSADEVLAETWSLFDRLTNLVRNLPEAELNEPGKFERSDDKSLGMSLVDRTYWFHYHDEHAPAINFWMARLAGYNEDR